MLYRYCTGHVQIPYRPEFFSGPIFTTAQAVFITAKIAFIFTSLFAVHIYDFHISTVNLKTLLFVMWMVGGRVDLKITIIPVNNDNKNNDNNNNDNNNINITISKTLFIDLKKIRLFTDSRIWILKYITYCTFFLCTKENCHKMTI